MKEVTYTIVRRTHLDEEQVRIHTGPTIDETIHSIKSLRTYHPEVIVNIYTDISRLHLIDVWKNLGVIRFFPVGVERNELNYKHEDLWERNKWPIPDLRVLMAKLDSMILHPTPSLFLDSDTEIHGPIDEIFDSEEPYLHLKEYPFNNSSFSLVITNVKWQRYGINPNKVAGMAMYNSGVVWIPKQYRPILWDVKNWVVENYSTQVGCDRLKEQIGLSVFLQDKFEKLKTCEHLIDHLWWRRGLYGKQLLNEEGWRWYDRHFSKVSGE